MIQDNERIETAQPGYLATFMVLFKVRIVVLLLLAALGGAYVASQGRPGGGSLFLLLTTGALSAMGSSAINEYVERERDARMLRTKRRPLVSGAISRPSRVLAIAIAMILAAVGIAYVYNPALAFFLALGAFIYVVIYTIWLKPRTSLNIVIGGLAGSCAVLSGSAAVGAWNDLGALLLAALLFFWTPIHFWAFAIVYKEDYARAGVPMLPVTATPKAAAAWGLAHGIAAGLCAAGLATRPGLGPIYFIPVAIATALLIGQGIELVTKTPPKGPLGADRGRQPTIKHAWRLFHTSNIFLAVVLVSVVVSTAVSAH
jgi:protoheme IX farnesyltransferase